MLPTTSTATSLWDLMDSLSPETDWNALHKALEKRLQAGSPHNPTLTTPERQLLTGLRLREQCLASPLYAKREETDPGWWITIMASAGARIADYPAA